MVPPCGSVRCSYLLAAKLAGCDAVLARDCLISTLKPRPHLRYVTGSMNQSAQIVSAAHLLLRSGALSDSQIDPRLPRARFVRSTCSRAINGQVKSIEDTGSHSTAPSTTIFQSYIVGSILLSIRAGKAAASRDFRGV
jgi:hypothetical protein